MYKGYKKELVGGCYKIYNADGVACMTVTKEYLETRSFKAVIEGLLKRRSPKKPKKEFVTSVMDGKLSIQIRCFCPKCARYLGETDDEYKYHHCPCGQVIDWSGV